MKLKLKGYKVAHPEAFNYYGDFWNDPSQYGIIYGKTQRDALNKYCMDNRDTGSYFEIKKTARTRRFKEADLYSIEIDELLKDLSKEELNHLTHSLGVEKGGVFKGKFYRNYSLYYEVNQSFNKLIDLGLFETYKKFNSHVYRVTSKGQQAAISLLLTTRTQIDLLKNE